MNSDRYYVVGQIEQAFFELLCEKDYTEITVTDIIRKAQVSRASFYRHYKSSSEIIDKKFASFFEQYMNMIIPSLLSSDEKKLREILFMYAYRNIEIQKMLSQCLPSNVAVIFSRFMTYIQSAEIIDSEISTEDKYRLSARAGVINSVLMKWVSDGQCESTEEIVNHIMNYIMRL